MRTALALLAVSAVLLAATAATATTPVPTIQTVHDCNSGGLTWTYTNHAPNPVTIQKQRVKIPGYPGDTTLVTWNRTLEAGGSMDHGITGIIGCVEGEPCNGELQPLPDGTYTNGLWLTDGTAKWFVKQQTVRACYAD